MGGGQRGQLQSEVNQIALKSISLNFLYFLSFLKKKFIYLIYLFLAVSCLCCCAWAPAGSTLQCGAQASHCGGVCCCGARHLGARASVVVARGP